MEKAREEKERIKQMMQRGITVPQTNSHLDSVASSTGKRPQNKQQSPSSYNQVD
jgi:hypothetical protein